MRVPSQEERATGAAPLTQFGRMCAKLGITIIPASPPQAKGRIERHHGTHQDRLVKKLRRHGIAEVAAANAFLETAYWPEHNGRFARVPASTDDFHVAVPRGVSLASVFRLEETRTVSNDWVVRYANRLFQLARQSHQPPARSTVQVLEDAAGQIEIRYRQRRIQSTEIPTLAPVAAAASGPAKVASPRRPIRHTPSPPAHHPWRRKLTDGAKPIWRVLDQ